METICENEYFQRKLILTNNKPQNNKQVYDKVIKELNKKYESNFHFSIKQVQINFKNCVSQCKRISLLQKTASGVKNFVQNKGLGQWFMQIYHFVSSKIRANLSRKQSPRIRSQHQKKESEEKGEIEEEVVTTSRKTEKGNSSKLSTEGENPVSQTIQ